MTVVMKKGKQGGEIGGVKGYCSWDGKYFSKGSSLGLREVNAWERYLLRRRDSKSKDTKTSMSFTY